MRPLLPVLLLIAAPATGCQEYDIAPKEDDPVDPPDDTDLPRDTSPPADTDPPPAPTCADATLSLSGWTASAPFATEADPADGLDRPFHSPSFDDTAWEAVSLPDVNGAPAGSDRAYRATLLVTGTPPNVKLDLQSDDGITVWLDGTLLGQWGGDWQEEGCVNDDASCGEYEIVAPVDISAAATPGEHVVAFRVSNATVNSYADLSVRCEDAP